MTLQWLVIALIVVCFFQRVEAHQQDQQVVEKTEPKMFEKHFLRKRMQDNSIPRTQNNTNSVQESPFLDTSKVRIREFGQQNSVQKKSYLSEFRFVRSYELYQTLIIILVLSGFICKENDLRMIDYKTRLINFLTILTYSILKLLLLFAHYLTEHQLSTQVFIALEIAITTPSTIIVPISLIWYAFHNNTQQNNYKIYFYIYTCFFLVYQAINLFKLVILVKS